MYPIDLNVNRIDLIDTILNFIALGECEMVSILTDHNHTHSIVYSYDAFHHDS